MAASKTAKEKEFDLDKKITVRSIAEWNTGFRRSDNTADVTIMPKGTVRLTRNEVIAQCNSGNKLFLGTDSRGGHATLLIDDPETRVELGFESDDGTQKQACFSDELVKSIFGIDSQPAFEDAFKSAFVTRSEKIAVIEAIKRLGINDYRKIRFVERYTGFNL